MKFIFAFDYSGKVPLSIYQTFFCTLDVLAEGLIDIHDFTDRKIINTIPSYNTATNTQA